MVLTNSLLTQTRDDIKTLMETLFVTGDVGDDNTTPTSSDTALGNSVFSDGIDEFDSSVTDAVTASFRILTTEANGETIKETGWLDTSANLLTHNLVNDINKTSDISIFVDTTIQITVSET